MKLFFIIHFFLVAAIYGCRDAKPVLIQEFIPGTYIRFSSHELGKEHDTLTISVQNENATQYKITRRWKYERTGEAPEYQLIKTAGIYRDTENLLEDMDTGDLYSFDLKQNCLFIGTIKYQML
ncbi:hypothetical protein CAP36_12325 [Chitinophagaceae bacterium IBVUCB2]|nr:hypothetical protein CAP36_12325 [Chitinophagaceae bacterium IBVUCB2]